MDASRTSADIAKFLFLNASDIASRLKNLEARGFISRERNEANRHQRTVRLTSRENEELISLMFPVFDALLETRHSDDRLIRISAARDLVTRKRHADMS